MARTVRELREWLFTWENQDELVAFSIWTQDDIVVTLDDYSSDGFGNHIVDESAPEVWAKIVDEIQSEFEEGWVAEKMSESVRESVINYVLEKAEQIA
jgi:hypothetical protein